MCIYVSKFNCGYILYIYIYCYCYCYYYFYFGEVILSHPGAGCSGNIKCPITIQRQYLDNSQ